MESKILSGAVIVAALAAATLLTRFLPFLLFPADKEQPGFIRYLGKTLPYASMGLLVVYCLKSVTWTTSPFGIPEAAAVLCVAVLHRWKHNVLISIGAGTVIYMALVQMAAPMIVS